MKFIDRLSRREHYRLNVLVGEGDMKTIRQLQSLARDEVTAARLAKEAQEEHDAVVNELLKSRRDLREVSSQVGELIKLKSDLARVKRHRDELREEDLGLRLLILALIEREGGKVSLSRTMIDNLSVDGKLRVETSGSNLVIHYDT